MIALFSRLFCFYILMPYDEGLGEILLFMSLSILRLGTNAVILGIPYLQVLLTDQNYSPL